jgi:uncharacterized protein (DUF2236 family)
MARAVHGDLASMVIGGLAALFLQSLHPLAMAGVAEHSGYRDDPMGRLRRTAAFVGTTTFGTVADADRAFEQVQRVHRRVRGVAPDGRPYDAADPELVTWIHVAEVSSFLASARRFGSRAFDAQACDAYYDEVAVVARRLGASWVPTSADEVEAYLGRMRPTLHVGPQARAARDFLVRGVARRPEDRAVYTLVVAAAASLLPGWARDDLGLRHLPFTRGRPAQLVDGVIDGLVVLPATRLFSAGVRWAVGGGAAPVAPVTGP